MDIVKECFADLLVKWKYDEESAEWISTQFRSYREGSSAFQSTVSARDAYTWWSHTKSPTETGMMRTFALRFLSISPTSADAERLFSDLGRINTKARNRMKSVTMKQLVQVKIYLRSQVHPGTTEKDSTSASTAKLSEEAEEEREGETGNSSGTDSDTNTVAGAMEDTESNSDRALSCLEGELDEDSEWDIYRSFIRSCRRSNVWNIAQQNSFPKERFN